MSYLCKMDTFNGVWSQNKPLSVVVFSFDLRCSSGKTKAKFMGHINSGPVMYFVISNAFSQSLYLKDILIHIFTKLNAGP